jgi:hypothetical protein
MELDFCCFHFILDLRNICVSVTPPYSFKVFNSFIHPPIHPSIHPLIHSSLHSRSCYCRRDWKVQESCLCKVSISRVIIVDITLHRPQWRWWSSNTAYFQRGPGSAILWTWVPRKWPGVFNKKLEIRMLPAGQWPIAWVNWTMCKLQANLRVHDHLKTVIMGKEQGSFKGKQI